MSIRLSAIDFTPDLEKLTKDFTGRQWVLDDIDRWLRESEERFFILTGEPGVGKSAITARLTQIRKDIAAYHFCRAGDVETVRPGRILRSLAAQLGEHLPDYGQALANTVKPIHLRVEVNINIGSMTGSRVTGVYIENLEESDPENELDLLIRAPLEELQKMYAERRQTQPALAIILIDSLDEAVTTTGTTLVKLLAQLSKSTSLPAWVRFILTSRSERRVLQEFEPLQPYNLQATSDEGLSDVRQYVSVRVAQSALQERLQVNQVQPQTLISEITGLSKGNFLYTTLLLNDIEAGYQTLDNLAALPRSIDDIYHRFLSRFSGEDWRDRYQPIFGVLAVAQEPISERHIADFTNIDPEDVRGSIRIARQLFKVETDERNKEIYSLFHQSLRDYLLNEDRNLDFWCHEQKQHQRITDFLERCSQSWQALERINIYGLRHLAQHLVKADRVEKLHKLLSLEKDGKNAWFKVKDDAGETASFLADVKLAWEQAYMEPFSSAAIGQQCRYILMTTSVNSLAEGIPPSLLAALLQRKKKSLSQVLIYAHQISDPYKRAQALCTLIPFIPSKLHHDIIQTGIAAASNCTFRWSRAKIQLALAKHLPEPERQQVEQEIFANILSSEMEWEKADTFATVAHILPKHCLEEALEVIGQMQDEYNQQKALIALLSRLSEDLLRRVLQTYATKEIRCKPAFIAAQIPYLPEAERLPLLQQALNDTQTRIKNEDLQEEEYWQAVALQELVPHLEEPLLRQALTIVQTYHARQEFYHKARIALAIRFAEIGNAVEAWTLIGSIDVPFLQVEALTILPPPLLKGQLRSAIEVVRKINDSYWRAEALGSLILGNSDCDPSLLEEALSVLTINDSDARAGILATLAAYLPEDQQRKAFTTVLTIKDSRERSAALVTLTAYLAEDLFEQAIAAAQNFEESRQEAQLLSALAPRLPESLQEQILDRIRWGTSRHFKQVLLALIPHLADSLLSEAFEIAQKLKDVEVWAALVPRLSTSLLERVLEVAKSFDDINDRRYLLATIILNLPQPECSAIVSSLLKESEPVEWESDRVHAAFALCLAREQHYTRALNRVCSIRDGSQKVDALMHLIPMLPESELTQVADLAQIQQLKWAEQLCVLAALPPHLSATPLNEIIAAVLNCLVIGKSDNYYKGLVKQGFIPLLAYSSLSIHQHSQLFARSIEATGLIQETNGRLQTLQAISPYIYHETVVRNRDLVWGIWKDTLHQIKAFNRKDLLVALQMISAYIFTLGGVEAVMETCNAIQEVGQWWE